MVLLLFLAGSAWAEEAGPESQGPVSKALRARVERLAQDAVDRRLPEDRRVAALEDLALANVRDMAPRVARALADKSPAVRRAAIATLSRLKARDQFLLILGLIGADPNPGVQTSALRAARKIGNRDALLAYIASLSSPHSAVRTEALRTLEFYTHRRLGFEPDAPEPRRNSAIARWDRWAAENRNLSESAWLIDGVRSGSPGERARALRELRRREASKRKGKRDELPPPPEEEVAVPALLDALEDENGPARIVAFETLRDMFGRDFGYRPETPGLEPEIAARRRAASVRRWRQWWKTARGEERITRLLAGLSAESHHTRIRCARLLAKEKERRAVPALIDMLNDPVSTVRAAADRALREITDHATGIDFSGGTPSQRRRGRKEWRAWWEVNRGRSRLDRLLGSLDDPTAKNRARAARALGHVGDARALGPLTRLLREDPASGVRATAALALGRIGDRRALGALMARLEDRREDSGVRMAASQGLAELSGENFGTFRGFGPADSKKNKEIIRAWRTWVKEQR